MDSPRSFAFLPCWMVHVTCLILFVKLCFGAPVATGGEAGPGDVDTTLRLGLPSSTLSSSSGSSITSVNAPVPHLRQELGFRPYIPRPMPVGPLHPPSQIFEPIFIPTSISFRRPSPEGPYTDSPVHFSPARGPAAEPPRPQVGSPTRAISIDLNRQISPVTTETAEEVQPPSPPVTPDATGASSHQPAKRPLSPRPETSTQSKSRRRSRWLVVDAQGKHITDNSQFALQHAEEVTKDEALEKWTHYSYNYLNQRVPSVIHQGAFFPDAVTPLQKRIDDLQATKTALLSVVKNGIRADDRSLLRTPFRDWPTIIRNTAKARHGFPSKASNELISQFHEDAAQLAKFENALRKIASGIHLH